MTIAKAERIIVRKVNRLFHDRAMAMFRMIVMNTGTTISDLRINPAWPLKGSISFNRNVDNKRVKLWLDGKMWRGETTDRNPNK